MKASMSLPLGFTLALIINLLLFLAIQKLVQPEHSTFSLPELVTLVDFIRLKKEEKIPEASLHEILPKKISPPKKIPPPELTDPEKPKPKQITPATPQIILPLHMTSGPHLGAFLEKPEPEKAMAPQTAPMPDDLVVETDVVPTYRTKPRYPSRARRAGLNGVVTVEFTITSKGAVIDPIIIKSSPPKVFDKPVLSAIRRWKFKPKFVNGHAVNRRARQDINFNIRS